MHAVNDLIESLADSDAEGVSLALSLALATKSASEVSGRDWGPAGPPKWHPDHPQHPHHDAYLDHYETMGDRFREHPDVRSRLLPAHREPDAEERAAAVRADPAFVHPSRRADIEADASLLSHPSHPNHDVYLANPEWYHTESEHNHPRGNWQTDGRSPDWGRADSSIHLSSGRASHPLYPGHMDREHFLDAHSRNGPNTGTVGSASGVDVVFPYR